MLQHGNRIGVYLKYPCSLEQAITTSKKLAKRLKKMRTPKTRIFVSHSAR